ncbi:hypothetical protein AK812_SmicGene11515 [Symbiodinium microadriaticum]|uniref:Uncharacterized protein n=1 Tax=Symbiodinium microadriaticum TaxID=2951 RepID=A0A1Q9ED20_SYMMI|nr:hypothetical protein AK812_SmicGene11515 [Symbiodinium microadriaticum]
MARGRVREVRDGAKTMAIVAFTRQRKALAVRHEQCEYSSSVPLAGLVAAFQAEFFATYDQLFCHGQGHRFNAVDVLHPVEADGCPAAWPATFINLKSKPKGQNEVNPWEDMNKECVQMPAISTLTPDCWLFRLCTGHPEK